MSETIESVRKEHEAQQLPDETIHKVLTAQIVMEVELDLKNWELKRHKEAEKYVTSHYSVSKLSPDIIKMETGLLTEEVFDIAHLHCLWFKDSITYFYGWKVKSILFEDQISITLMKLRQNYTNLHLAQLFSCRDSTISNILTTFIRCHADILLQLCAALVNLQFPLVREGFEDTVFE